MKSLFVLTILLAGVTVRAQTCRPSEVPYRVSMRNVLIDLAARTGAIEYPASGESFSLSLLPEKYSTIAGVPLKRIRVMAFTGGLNSRAWNYDLDNQGSCTSDAVVHVIPEGLGVPAAPGPASAMARAAFAYAARNFDSAVPWNTHSGSQSFKFLPPKFCAGAADVATVHIVRYHHVSGGIAKRVFSFLMTPQGAGYSVSAFNIQPGSVLPNLCP